MASGTAFAGLSGTGIASGNALSIVEFPDTISL